ncbi:MAG: FIST signal transduction protein [Acidimicrobiales bacterium]
MGQGPPRDAEAPLRRARDRTEQPGLSEHTPSQHTPSQHTPSQHTASSRHPGPGGRAGWARFASAVSEHPLTAHAVGEVVGQVLEKLGTASDLAAVFVTPPHAGALEDVARAVEATLSPGVLIGCAAESVVATGMEIEATPAVSLWAGSFGGAEGIRLAPVPAGPGEPPEDASALLLLADPFSFDADGFLAWLGAQRPGLPVIGGFASAAAGPGGNRLVLGHAAVTSGAVGAWIGAGADVTAIVSQGARPVGSAYTVTGISPRRGGVAIVDELAGRPALERLVELVESGLPARDRDLAGSGGLQVGRVIDEHKETFAPGDFLVRNLVGVDRASGSIAVADSIELGQTVQFHLHDAVSADEDLRALLARHEPAHRVDAALAFTCNGRGTRLFGAPHHDAKAIEAAFGPVPVSGFFAAGELGPVGAENFAHGYTASLAVFGPERGRAGAG